MRERQREEERGRKGVWERGIEKGIEKEGERERLGEREMMEEGRDGGGKERCLCH